MHNTLGPCNKATSLTGVTFRSRASELIHSALGEVSFQLELNQVTVADGKAFSAARLGSPAGGLARWPGVVREFCFV